MRHSSDPWGAIVATVSQAIIFGGAVGALVLTVYEYLTQ
jgi:hypothetical protein